MQLLTSPPTPPVTPPAAAPAPVEFPHQRRWIALGIGLVALSACCSLAMLAGLLWWAGAQ